MPKSNLFHPQPKPIVTGKYLVKNEIVKVFIDNEQVRAAENKLRFPRKVMMLWLVALTVLIYGIYVAWNI